MGSGIKSRILPVALITAVLAATAPVALRHFSSSSRAPAALELAAARARGLRSADDVVAREAHRAGVAHQVLSEQVNAAGAWSALGFGSGPAVSPLNDLVLHRSAVDTATSALYRDAQARSPTLGEAPHVALRAVDHWLSSVGAGFPLVAHYQHLPYALAAALHGLVAGEAVVPLGSRAADAAVAAAVWLTPAAAAWAVLQAGASAIAAVCAASLLVIVNDAAPPDESAPPDAAFLGYGVGWHSYTEAGHGLWTQAFAVPFALIALGHSVRAAQLALAAADPSKSLGSTFTAGLRAALADGLLGGLCLAVALLSHVFYGYVTAVSVMLLIPAAVLSWRSRSRVRVVATTGAAVVVVGGTAFAVAAYFVVPFVAFRRTVCDWEHRSWKFDSVGAAWASQALVTGNLLDHGIGAVGVPVVTLLSAAGLLVAVARTRVAASVESLPIAAPRVFYGAWAAMGFVLWFLMFCGRRSFGVLVSIIPLVGEVHMHRFVGAVQIFAVLLSGVAFDAALERASAGAPAPTKRGGSKRAAKGDARQRPLRLWLLAIGSVLLWAAAWSRQQELLDEGDRVVQHESLSSAEALDVAWVVGELRSLPPGRVYYGSLGWHRPAVLAALQLSGLDIVGPEFHTMSYAGDFAQNFDPDRYDHYRLFNVRYVVAPRGSHGNPPEFLEHIGHRSDPVTLFRVREVPTSVSPLGLGYFSVVSVRALLPGLTRTEVRALGGREDPWPQSAQAASWLPEDAFVELDTVDDVIQEIGFQWMDGAGPDRALTLPFPREGQAYVPPPPGSELPDGSESVPDTGCAVHIHTADGDLGPFRCVAAAFGATRGANAEVRNASLVLAQPLNACEEPPADARGASTAAIAVVQRGTCTYDVKASHVLALGAAAMVVVDTSDYEALSEMSVAAASEPQMSGLLAVMVPRSTKAMLVESAGADSSASVVVSRSDAADDDRQLAPPLGGHILNETVGSRADSFEAYVTTTGEQQFVDVMLKVSYHPNWACVVDGAPSRPRAVLPHFMVVRVPADGDEATHHVMCEYRPPAWKGKLLAVSALAALAAAAAGTWLRTR